MSSGNISIEEIGPEEVEENVPPLDDDAEILLSDDAEILDPEDAEIINPDDADIINPDDADILLPNDAESLLPDAEILLPDDDGDFDTAGKKETVSSAAAEVAVAAPADDLPLEPLEEAAPAVAPPPEAAPAPKVVVAPRQRAPVENDDEEEDDDDIDETYVERLIGLTEMFPKSLTSGSVNLVKGCISMSQNTYNFARAASWVVFTSATILFLPIMIETERLGIEDQQKQHKSQMLLGPGVASSGGAPSLGPPPI